MLDPSAAPQARDARAVREARAAATSAATSAHVEVVRLAGPQEASAARDLFTRIWGRGDEPVVTAELLRVISFVGGYVHGARTPGAAGALVGAAVGLPTIEGRSPRAGLHSHVTGVVRRRGSGGVGYALKLDQRAWALERGLHHITWTFDPLVRRNAYFNLGKLVAEAVAYLPDFYGEMTDELNAGQGSDRLLARWDLAAPHVAAAAAGRPHELDAARARPALRLRADGGPEAIAWRADAPALLVAVPADIEALRGTDPGQALAWRHAVRDVLGGLLADGWVCRGMAGREAYLLVPGGPGTVPR